jgi:hypothetical protein
MKHLLAFLLAACAVTAQGQTIKTLGYNTTNGNVVYAGTNNLNFTNYVYFNSDTSIGGSAGELRYGGQVRIELETGLIGMPLFWPDPTNAAGTRINLGLGATWLTNDNVTNFRTAIGLGATNDVTVNSLTIAEGTNTYIALFDDGGEFSTGITMSGNFGISFSSNAAGITRTNLGLGGTNTVTFAGLTNNGDITINQTTTNNGLLYIRRTNNESFLGLANLIASNNTTISNETLFRVGVAEATYKSALFGFRSTITNGEGVAVFSVFGYNALMMIGPSDPAAGTNPIEAMVYSINPTNKVMTLIKTNTGAMLMHRPIGIDTAGVSTNAPANTTNVAGWIQFYVGTNSVRVPYYQ